VHGMGGRLPTHETTWRTTPNPDVLHSSAWLDVENQPYVLWIPPMEGHWYSVQFEDSYSNDVAYLSSRTVGSVGGWYLVAHESWQGERPPGLMEDEVRIPTPITWLLLRVAATPKQAADFHERYQAQFKLLPLEVYERNPKAAALAPPQAQASPNPPLRAPSESRGTLEAFRIIQQRLRQLAPRGGEEALLALFLEAAPDDALQGRGDGARLAQDLRWLGGEDGIHRLHSRIAAEGAAAGEHLKEDGAERENIGAMVGVEAPDLLGVPGGELVGVDAAERVAEENDVAQAQVPQEGLDVASVVAACVARGVIGVPVSALVERDEAPLGSEDRGQRRERHGLHEVRVQGDQRAPFAARVQVRELQAVVSEFAPLHARRISCHRHEKRPPAFAVWKGDLNLVTRWESCALL